VVFGSPHGRLKLKSWLVYKMDGELCAVEYEWTWEQVPKLEKSGAVIVGNVYTKTAQDAIDYIKEVT
jgi:hypothetical protein